MLSTKANKLSEIIAKRVAEANKRSIQMELLKQQEVQAMQARVRKMLVNHPSVAELLNRRVLLLSKMPICKLTLEQFYLEFMGFDSLRAALSSSVVQIRCVSPKRGHNFYLMKYSVEQGIVVVKPRTRKGFYDALRKLTRSEEVLCQLENCEVITGLRAEQLALSTYKYCAVKCINSEEQTSGVHLQVALGRMYARFDQIARREVKRAQVGVTSFMQGSFERHLLPASDGM